MLRKQLLIGASEVLHAITVSELLQGLRRNSKSDNPAKLLQALREYSIAAHGYSDAGRQVAAVFELQKLEDPEFWSVLLGESDQLLPMRQRLMFILRELPQLLALLTQHSVVEEPESKGSELTAMQIRLIEDDGHFSTVKRVIQALSACQEIYDALAVLEDETSQPLAIAAIDSGSDKAFDLFGAAKVMAEFRLLVLSMWDLVVFHRERKLGRQLEVIASALPILERIQKLEDAQKLGREQAQIIRNGIIDGTKKFLDAGVTLDEFNSRSHTDPRVLLAPEQKLLAAPPTQSQVPAGSGPDSSSPHPSDQGPASGTRAIKTELSEEDIRRISEHIVKGMRGGTDVDRTE